MPYGDKKLRGVAFLPAHEVIAPKEYSGVNWRAAFDEKFVKLGKIQSDVLTSYLEELLDRNQKYNTVEQKFAHADLVEEPADRDLVLEVLKKLRGGDITNVDLSFETVEALKELIGEENFFKLCAMVTIREDEMYFKNTQGSQLSAGGAVFDDLQIRIAKYNIEPETVGSLEKIIGSPYFLRIKRLYSVAVQRGVQENRQYDAVRLAAKFVTFDDGKALYAVSKKFAPVISNPNRKIVCDEMFASTSGYASDYGNWIFCAVDEFLESDVAGVQQPNAGVMNKYESENIEFNIPDIIEIVEEQNLELKEFVKTNLHGLEWDCNITFETQEGKYKPQLYYDQESNALKIYSLKRAYNHDQFTGTVRFDFHLKNPAFRGGSSRDFSKTVKIIAVNKDEAPAMSINAPQYIREGELFCADALSDDFEGDNLVLNWEQTSGAPLELVKHYDGARVCAQVKAVGKVVKPIKLKLSGTSVVPDGVVPASTGVAERMIFVLPKVSIGEDVDLPIDVIASMTDPNGDKMRARAFASEKNLYIMMRLPDDLQKYSYKNDVQFANTVEFRGVRNGSVTVASRKWSPFQRVPSDDGMYVYFSASPLEPYIEEGRYRVDDHISVSDYNYTQKTNVKIGGDVVVKDTTSFGKIEVTQFKRVSDSTIRVTFKVPNDKNGEPFLKPDPNNPAYIGVHGYNFTGKRKIDLYTRVSAAVSGSDKSFTEFSIDIPLPTTFSLSDESVAFAVPLVDANGRTLELKASEWQNERNNAGDIWNVSFETPQFPMPYPFMMITAKPAEGFEAMLPYLQRGKYELALAANGKHANFAAISPEVRGDRVVIPLKEWLAYGSTPSYELGGGTIAGKLTIGTLPVDFNDPRKGSWKMEMTVSVDRPVETAFVRKPRSEEMFADGNGKKRAGEDERSEPRPDELAIEKFNKEIQIDVRPTQNAVKAGEEFYIDFYFPEIAGKFNLVSLNQVNFSGLKKIFVSIEDEQGNKHESYALRMEKVNKNSMRVYFKAPNMLVGKVKYTYVVMNEYSGATYDIVYLNTGGEKFSLKRDRSYSYYYVLEKIKFDIDSTKKIEGEGKIIEEKK